MARYLPAVIPLLLIAAGAARAETEVPRAVWQKRVIHAPAASPLFTGDRICFVGLDRKIVCVDAGTGKRRWRRNLPSPAALPPLEVGENLIVTTGEPEPGVVALDRGTGHQRWRVRLDSRPVALRSAGGVAVCATAKGTITALDPREGTVAWERNLDADLIALVDLGERLAVAGRADSVWLIDPHGGAVTERRSIPGRRSVAPVAVDGSIVWASYEGEILAVDLLGGGQPRDLQVRRPQIGPIGVRQGSIAFAAVGGEIEAFAWPALDPLWIVETGETVSTGVQSGPSGWIVASQSGAIRSYTADRGSPAWSLEFRAPISVAPAVDGRRLCVIDDRGGAVLYDLQGDAR